VLEQVGLVTATYVCEVRHPGHPSWGWSPIDDVGSSHSVPDSGLGFVLLDWSRKEHLIQFSELLAEVFPLRLGMHGKCS
jgi:hypothetical protein